MENQQPTPNRESNDRAFFEGLLPRADPQRRLLAAVLLMAFLDAYRGDESAWCFLQGDRARHMAECLDIQQWPPTRAMLTSRSELERRAKEIHEVPTVA